MMRQAHRAVPASWPWVQPPPPAPAFEGMLKPGPRYSTWFGHQWLHRPQPNPGAPAFAYQALGLVEMTPIGPSIANRRQIKPESSAGIVQFANLGLTTAGLGGLVQGQVVTAPLLVPGFLQLDTGGDETPYATG